MGLWLWYYRGPLKMARVAENRYYDQCTETVRQATLDRDARTAQTPQGRLHGFSFLKRCIDSFKPSPRSPKSLRTKLWLVRLLCSSDWIRAQSIGRTDDFSYTLSPKSTKQDLARRPTMLLDFRPCGPRRDSGWCLSRANPKNSLPSDSGRWLRYCCGSPDGGGDPLENNVFPSFIFLAVLVLVFEYRV